MNEHIPVDYFTGERNVSLDYTLQEAEVLFAASDSIKAMAESGELLKLHEKFNSVNERAHSEYHSIRDRINNIILAA
jgi:hypothetical protein